MDLISLAESGPTFLSESETFWINSSLGQGLHTLSKLWRLDPASSKSHLFTCFLSHLGRWFIFTHSATQLLTLYLLSLSTCQVLGTQGWIKQKQNLPLSGHPGAGEWEMGTREGRALRISPTGWFGPCTSQWAYLPIESYPGNLDLSTTSSSPLW